MGVGLSDTNESNTIKQKKKRRKKELIPIRYTPKLRITFYVPSKSQSEIREESIQENITLTDTEHPENKQEEENKKNNTTITILTPIRVRNTEIKPTNSPTPAAT